MTADPKPQRLPELTDKQLAVVRLALVFGFVTIAAVMRFHGWSYDAATGMLGSRKRYGWLRSFPVRYGLTGFQPTLAAARELKASPCLVRPFGGLQSVLPRFAALTDCANRNVLPLASSQIPLEDLKSEDYRLIPGDHHPVCFAHVDAGANPLRLVHKVNAHFRDFARIEEFRPLVRDGLFAVRVLTPSAGKAEALAAVLAKRPAAGPVEIEVIEPLTEFLA